MDQKMAPTEILLYGRIKDIPGQKKQPRSSKYKGVSMNGKFW
jgi:hypothetical protein